MKAQTVIRTTKTIELNEQDLRSMLLHAKLIPEGWKYFAMDVKSEGAKESAKSLTVTLSSEEIAK